MTPTKPEDALVDELRRQAIELREMVRERFNAVSGPIEADALDQAADAITTLLERERRLREALREIKSLKPRKIGDSGFSTGPQLLFDQAQRIARAALTGEATQDGR